MAEGRTRQDTQTDAENGSGVGTAVMSATQDAAGVVRSTAEKAAAKWPDAVAGAQVAATETQRRLDEMPSQTLVVGTSFSLGLGVGLFFSGANRLLVLLAMLPAAAMALTMFGRDPQNELGAAASRRASNKAASCCAPGDRP